MTNRKQVAAGSTGPLSKLPAIVLSATLLSPAVAAEPTEELVSFRCALAIDAVLARLDEQTQNIVIQQALDNINDKNGQLVCIYMDTDEIQVRLQSTDMTSADNRLVFSLDANTYSVRKTFYGR